MLTSSGITNKTLSDALKKLAGEEKINIAFIPTGANPEKGDKGWLIDNLNECKKLGDVDIVDIAVLDKPEWLPRLKEANVIFVGGGNTVYLMDWIRKSGLIDELKDLLKTRVYVGISAGSIVLAEALHASSEFLYMTEDGKKHKGLGYVDFNFRPHLNAPHFPKVIDENLKEISLGFDEDLYAMDDESGIICVDGEIEVVSEGKWFKYAK